MNLTEVQTVAEKPVATDPATLEDTDRPARPYDSVPLNATSSVIPFVIGGRRPSYPSRQY